ncbi:transcription termination factor Rho [Rhodococcus spongiicola]|uniref:Transcription termination factor Rho n=1 Tax=Rhodococcus spongiicola TaxID=2487352 RepID=A0A438B4N8_9NOCA|nr:transcription termination factor Rho [Rhodococcus spongiicola]RVW05932.1 transcription termination factor Rho [Rhodococcus spongiicola]
MTDTDLIATPVRESLAEAAGAGAGNPPKISEAAPHEGAVAASPKRAEARRGAGLSGMVLTELRSLAGELGIKGTSGMRKGDLIAAIKERQGEVASKSANTSSGAAVAAPAADKPAADKPAADKTDSPGEQTPSAPTSSTDTRDSDAEQAPRRGRQRRGATRRAGAAEQSGADGESGATVTTPPAEARTSEARPSESKEGAKESDAKGETREQGAREQGKGQQGGERGGRRERGDRGERGDRNQGGSGPRGEGRGERRDGDDEEGGRGRRGRRFRERRRGRDRGEAGEGREPEIREDDVLQPVAGILDVLDNYAFVRTSGYLAGPNDVYVSMNLVRKNGLRRGDAITGAVRAPREGEQGNQRQKFNPLVRLDTVNGHDPEAARKRPEFNKLTPLYPNQRLRLETTPNILTTRVIDLVMPIGKGQRALIVSPPKAGKTTVLQDIANAISVNNPECYLMVVLVDERPEEVTDMQRSVNGEVIASTFDRPPSDHTSVAELAIERAKRLVEQGRDVVVLLDSITRLGRAYNNSSPASGRILSGGVDSTALYPPKRFLGAARNIENGGSLTIIATAMVETGSTGDTVIFEEFKGTGNAELKLDRKIAERRVFPAVDVNPSGTRKDELLMSPDEFAVVHKLRRVLSGLDSHQAIDLLIDRLKKSKSNVEFLMNVSKTAPSALED